jgi:mono/diheme cytochrome c family protein
VSGSGGTSLVLGTAALPRIGFTLACFAVVAGAVQAAPQAPTAAAAGSVRAQVDAGKALFATTCANCHGSAGKGAIGPALADRNLSLDTLRNTILNGRVGSPMPAFKDELDGTSLAAVIAYAAWLSSGGHLPDEPIALSTDAASSAARLSTQPISIGKETGVPARGALLFFDATRLQSCRVCHTFNDKGGPVGPDLAIRARSPAEIFGSISRPRVPDIDYPEITVRLDDGSSLAGVKSAETADAYVLFDVSSLPPVRRTVLKSRVREAVPEGSTGIFDHTALGYSRQDLLDLSAYLGQRAAGGQP